MPSLPLIRAALEHHRAGRLDEAERLYRGVLSAEPRNVDALQMLGVIAHQRGRHADAIELMRRAIDVQAETAPAAPSPHALNNLGEAYRAAGEPDQAIACYRRALEIKPDYAEAHYHLGQALFDRGEAGAAVEPYRRALALKPQLVAAHHNLGMALKQLGEFDAAAECFRTVLELDPANGLAAHLLAAVTGLNPDRAPRSYVESLFDRHAPGFDDRLVHRLGYRVPEAMGRLAAARMSAPDGTWVVLDLGCGTGLAGAAIAGRCRHLVGVDLSANMLAEARARGVYDRLEHADLVSMARGEAAGTYDLILAADVFIYVGDLVDVMREAHRILRPGGLFALSAEAAESVPDATAPQQLDAGYRLQGSGRYAHSAAYLRAVAAQVDFELAELSGIEVRLENEQPVQGWLALLRR